METRDKDQIHAEPVPEAPERAPIAALLRSMPFGEFAAYISREAHEIRARYAAELAESPDEDE